MWSISDRVNEITGGKIRPLTNGEIRGLLAEQHAHYPEMKRGQVATAIALGHLTMREIGEMFHISTRQIQRWKEDPDFIQQINNIRLISNIQLGIEVDHEQ